MTRKPLLVLLTSVLLLPASCACGYFANQEQQKGALRNLTWENLLWIGALALMLVWARQVSKIYRAEPAEKETDE